MADGERTLLEGNGGPYGELASRPLPDGLVLVFMPSLVVLLEEAERIVGGPLTSEQVSRIRDAALVVVTPLSAAQAVEEGRGYADIDPANAWESWLAIRERGG